ncbi:PleD family two-component system response regulator [Thermoproteota archaeon]
MKQKILIIDDDPDVAMITSIILENAGYSVLTEDGTKDILAYINELTPDAVLLDANLSAMNGLEMCKKLKKDKQYHHIPIILFTGYDYDADLILKKVKADAYLQKPYDRKELLLKVGQCLSKG